MFNVLRSASQRRQKGSSLVESALVMLSLLAILIFIMDMGRILLVQQFITERARTTVRMAVVNNWTSTAVQNYLVYNNTTAPTGGGSGYLGLLPSQVSYQALGASGTVNYRLQVKVSGVPALTWIPYIAGSFILAPIVATMPGESLGAAN
jgi:Flp pilus assembly protein TadG